MENTIQQNEKNETLIEFKFTAEGGLEIVRIIPIYSPSVFSFYAYANKKYERRLK